MAITHFTPQLISRGEGRSAVAAAAYRHCVRMLNEREGRLSDFSNKPDFVHEEFVLPAEAPTWAKAMVGERSVASASEAFWNKVEIYETRKDAQLAKEFVLALPIELSREQNIALMRDFISGHMSDKGVVADWVYHDAPGNPHVHLMTSLRPLTNEGFGGKKVAVLDQHGQPLRNQRGQIQYRLWAGDKADFLAMREAWYAAQNRHLALAGHDVRVDGRSYGEQGIDLSGTPHIGVASKNIDRKARLQGRHELLERLALHDMMRRKNAARIAKRPEVIIDAVSREKSVFDERDIAKYLHRYVDDAIEFQNLMAQIRTSPELVVIETEAFDFETGEVLPARYATREMIRVEAEMASRAEHLASSGRFGVKGSFRKKILAGHHHLSDEQQLAIEHITGDERLAVVVGRAGAGKTTMMKAAREIWEAGGYKVVGGALAGKAAEGLEREAGIVCRTLASWQLQWQRDLSYPDDKTVFVMDEAGMVASGQMADVVATVTHSGAKLVLVGDADQLQPIEAGAAFRALAGIVGYAELATIYRQRQQWMRDASMALARGEIAGAISTYQEKGHLIGAGTKAEAVSALIRDWDREYNPSDTSLILAHLRRDVRMLNELAREKLLHRGVIDQGHAFRTEDGMRQFSVGEQIVFLKNDAVLGVKNGMIGHVDKADKGRIVVRVGEEDHGPGGSRRVEIDQGAYRNVDHGYATTIHKSQGATVDRVKVLGTLSLDRHLAYVALTRHRQDMRFYYGRISHEKAGGLVAVLSKRSTKNTTLEFAGSTLYSQALSYAENRGLYGIRLAAALAKNHGRWVVQQRERLALAVEKISSFIERLGQRQLSSLAVMPEPRAATVAPRPWLRGVATWAQTTAQVVEARLQGNAVLQAHWTEVRERMALIYEKPEEAISAMSLVDTLNDNGKARAEVQSHILDQLVRHPEAYGSLRGKAGLLVSGATRSERQRAIVNLPALSAGLQNYLRVRAETSEELTLELSLERAHQRIDLAVISKDAERVLANIRDAVDRNDMSAAMGLAHTDPKVKAEIDRLNKSVEAKFGQRGFLGSREPNGATFDAAAAKVSPKDHAKLIEAWPKLYAAQMVAAEERVLAHGEARNRAQSRGRDQDITR